MEAKKDKDAVPPLHVFIAKQMDQTPGLTNAALAEKLGYPRGNVIAMIRNGSMKVPINKVPALARALGLDTTALLQRVLMSYTPELWEALVSIVGDRLVTQNELDLLQVVRHRLHGLDIKFTASSEFTQGLEALVGELLDQQLRGELSPAAGVGAAKRDSKVGRLNIEMQKLLDQQAKDRQALRKRHQTAAPVSKAA